MTRSKPIKIPVRYVIPITYQPSQYQALWIFPAQGSIFSVIQLWSWE